MKKKLVCFTMTAAMALTAAVPAMAAGVTATPNNASVAVDGTGIAIGAYNIGGYNYFKLRDVAAALNGTGANFEVGYDADEKAIALTTGAVYSETGNELKDTAPTAKKTATVSDQKIILNGKAVSMQAYLIDGYNYFQLRELGKNLGFDVAWDEAAKAINMVTSGEAAKPVAPVVPEVPKEATLKILQNGSELKFASNQAPYIDKNGNVMVSVEAMAKHLGARLEFSEFNGVKFAEVSKTWTQATTPYAVDKNGDGVKESYPTKNGIVFVENSTEGEAGWVGFMEYDEYSGNVYENEGGGGPAMMTAMPVVKNGVFYVALDDLTNTFYIDRTWNAATKTYQMMPYQNYNYRYYYGIEDDNNTGILLIVDDHNVAKAKVKSVYIYDYMNNKEIRNVKFHTVSDADMKADIKENNIPYEGLVKIEMPNAFKGLDYFRVDVEAEFTKDNGATVMRQISYELERP